MKLLISGANGFLGSHFISFFKNMSFDIYTVGTKPISGNEKNFININSLSKENFKNFVNSNISYFIHLIGNPSLKDKNQNDYVNCDLGIKLLRYINEISFKKDVKCVFFGSAAEYGKVESSSNPVSELHSTTPKNYYGIAKNRQTKKALDLGKKRGNVFVLRPFSILGEGMPLTSAFGNFFYQIFKKKAKILETGNLNVYRDFIDIKDLVFLTWKLMQNEDSYGKIINICSGKPIILREMVKFVIEQAQFSIQINEMDDFYSLNENDIIYGNNSLLISLIDEFNFINWKTTLKRISGYYR